MIHCRECSSLFEPKFKLQYYCDDCRNWEKAPTQKELYVYKGMKPPPIRKRKDLTGQVFHRLTVLKAIPYAPKISAPFLCICECGTEKLVSGHQLRAGKTKSCGCLKKERDSDPSYFSRIAKKNTNKFGLKTKG